MKLIIVESPNKIKHISHFMGPGWTVLATAGHIMKIDDVGAYKVGVDTKNDFKAAYIFDKSKADLMKKIKDAAKNADEIFVCSDDDREGHKISDEIRELLKTHKKKLKRAVFDEITEKAVKKAIANPIPFDEEMIQAAESRAILDKLVGYRTSTIARSKISCESAGRVQSALLYLISKREREIQKFKAVKYWDIFLDFKKGRKIYTAKYEKAEGQKGAEKTISSQESADKIIAECKAGQYFVDSITEKDKIIEPKLPLTTSAMQQVASTNLGFAPAKTQKLAQTLFENGLITYIRTDSTRLSEEFQKAAEEYIKKNYDKTLFAGLKEVKKSENSQDAHEAIRPTDITKTPAGSGLTGDELKLYSLIYKITICAFFKPAKVKITDIIIKNGKYYFGLQGKQIVFESFLGIFNDEDENNEVLPEFKKNEEIFEKEIYSEAKETQPPQRYSEAGLVKLMEKTGIGRPSTYSSAIETLKKREYITVEKKSVHVSEKGLKLDDMLQKYFSTVINDKYTAAMENELDKISTGEESKLKFLSEFWKEFEPLLLRAAREINKDKPKAEVVEGKFCPECKKPLVKRIGKYGEFRSLLF